MGGRGDRVTGKYWPGGLKGWPGWEWKFGRSLFGGDPAGQSGCRSITTTTTTTSTTTTAGKTLKIIVLCPHHN